MRKALPWVRLFARLLIESGGVVFLAAIGDEVAGNFYIAGFGGRNPDPLDSLPGTEVCVAGALLGTLAGLLIDWIGRSKRPIHLA